MSFKKIDFGSRLSGDWSTQESYGIPEEEQQPQILEGVLIDSQDEDGLELFEETRNHEVTSLDCILDAQNEDQSSLNSDLGDYLETPDADHADHGLLNLTVDSDPGSQIEAGLPIHKEEDQKPSISNKNSHKEPKPSHTDPQASHQKKPPRRQDKQKDGCTSRLENRVKRTLLSKTSPKVVRKLVHKKSRGPQKEAKASERDVYKTVLDTRYQLPDIQILLISKLPRNYIKDSAEKTYYSYAMTSYDSLTLPKSARIGCLSRKLSFHNLSYHTVCESGHQSTDSSSSQAKVQCKICIIANSSPSCCLAHLQFTVSRLSFFLKILCQFANFRNIFPD